MAVEAPVLEKRRVQYRLDEQHRGHHNGDADRERAGCARELLRAANVCIRGFCFCGRRWRSGGLEGESAPRERIGGDERGGAQRAVQEGVRAAHLCRRERRRASGVPEPHERRGRAGEHECLRGASRTLGLLTATDPIICIRTRLMRYDCLYSLCCPAQWLPMYYKLECLNLMPRRRASQRVEGTLRAAGERLTFHVSRLRPKQTQLSATKSTCREYSY